MPRLLVLLTALVLLACPVAAQQTKFPTDSIRILVPYGPGGATDTSSRVFAEHFKKLFNVGVVVENKIGASGIIAIEEMMRAKPDGHTVMIGNVSTNGLTPILLKHKLKIDYPRDVVTVGRIVDAPTYMATTAKDFPAKTFQEFIALIKANPGKYRFSSAGHGSIQQVDTAVLASRTGIDMIHVPTKAGAPQIQRDLINGDTQLSWSNPASTLRFIKAGQVVALAVTTPNRLAILPDVPTLTELGYANVGSIQWQTMVVPAAVPAEVQQMWHKAIAETLKQPDIQQAIERIGFMPPPAMTLEETRAWALSEHARYSKIITELNIKTEE
jgi:tripartite-type tricarboxylate transporter receptor subunit TctC